MSVSSASKSIDCVSTRWSYNAEHGTPMTVQYVSEVATNPRVTPGVGWYEDPVPVARILHETS